MSILVPTDAERLTIKSNKPTIDAAVSSCISQLMRERPEIESDQAQAI